MPILHELRETFGPTRIIPRIYQPELDVVADFRTLAGLPIKTTHERLRENVSLRPAQLPILRVINADVEDAAVQARIRALFQVQLRGAHAPRYSPFPERLQADIADACELDWLALLAEVNASESPWPAIMPFAGSSLDAPAVTAEVARTVRLLAAGTSGTARMGLAARAWRKLRTDPRDFPDSVKRVLRQ